MLTPVQEISFGAALNLSLDNYYDLLKLQIGGLGSSEFLQLKLVADTVDISPKPVAEAGYRWFSYYNLLIRGDLQIEPSPVTGQVFTGAERLTDVYGKFLQKLRQYAVSKDLTPDEQIKVADYDKQTSALKDEALELALLDRQKWVRYAELMGYQIGDRSAYLQWSNLYGNIRTIERKMNEVRAIEFRKKTILDRQYPNPDDREIVDAEFEYENPAMRLRYPIFADYEYDNGSQFSANYLSTLPIGSTGLFDDRRVFSWHRTLDDIKGGSAGSFTATFNRTTGKSESITTDWSAGATVRYGFIKVNASASEHTSIQEDFNKGTTIELSAKSASRVNIIYPGWFKPTLFNHRHVKANIKDFEEFFADNGSLKYYPVAILLVRGFSVSFISTQNWSFNYERKFSASAGGGFNAFGINFGGNGSYSRHEIKHEVDQANTKLTIFDGDTTLRFVGYVVKKNNVFELANLEQFKQSLPHEAKTT